MMDLSPFLLVSPIPQKPLLGFGMPSAKGCPPGMRPPPPPAPVPSKAKAASSPIGADSLLQDTCHSPSVTMLPESWSLAHDFAHLAT